MLHNLDHLVAKVIDFDESEIDILSSEHSHLVLNLMTIWRAFRVFVSIIADIFTVARSISDMEN